MLILFTIAMIILIVSIVIVLIAILTSFENKDYFAMTIFVVILIAEIFFFISDIWLYKTFS